MFSEDYVLHGWGRRMRDRERERERERERKKKKWGRPFQKPNLAGHGKKKCQTSNDRRKENTNRE